MISAESGKEKYFTQLSNGSISIQADTAKGNGGSGDYFRPHDLICAGLASCLNISVRMELVKLGLNYDKVITKIDLNRDREDRTIFIYNIEIISDIDEGTKKEIIAKALDCPVKKTLSKHIAFESMSP